MFTCKSIQTYDKPIHFSVEHDIPSAIINQLIINSIAWDILTK